MERNTSFSYVPDAGWTGKGFSVTHEAVPAGAVKLTCRSFGGDEKEIAVSEVTCADGRVTVKTEDFGYKSAWTLRVGEDSYTRKDMDRECVEGIEGVFEPFTDGEVIYRLYTPKAKGPRPMILYLHGGGNGGTDNITQVAADYGVSQFAVKYPDFYVLVPQAPQKPGMMLPPVMPGSFAESDQTDKNGWHREYLAAVCDLIRGMIADGKVDPRRVYVTGLSMGGGGTLRAMSVGAGLFTAAVAVCPTMTPETFGILKNLTEARLWIATAYVDHTIYRHKYIVDGVLALKDAGNKNVHLTIYSPEDLAKYDIATDPELPLQARFSQNHASWVPTYHNEYGIMSWLTEQVKDQ